MFGKTHERPQKRIDCLIGAGTTVDGNVTFTGGLLQFQINARTPNWSKACILSPRP